MPVLTPYFSSYFSPLTRAIGAAGGGGGRIPQPGDYLTDESGNRLTTETITDLLTA